MFESEVPANIAEAAAQVVAYVRRALGVALEYDSDTLPIFDHYLRTVPDEEPATLALVLATGGAYFGEVVRRRMGGRWEAEGRTYTEWRLVLPTGLSFAPAGIVAAAILLSEEFEDLDTGFDAPPKVRAHFESILERMAEVTEETYYSLCGRLDTLEHIQEVLLAIGLEAAARGEGDLESGEPN